MLRKICELQLRAREGQLSSRKKILAVERTEVERVDGRRHPRAVGVPGEDVEHKTRRLLRQPDDRVERMLAGPGRYFAGARQRTVAEIERHIARKARQR
jgi:hypothetical protein